MSIISVNDASGQTKNKALVPGTGQTIAAADSLPVVQPSDAAAFRVTIAGSSTSVASGSATRAPVEPLGLPGLARQLTAAASSSNTVLTANISRISIYNRTADARFTIGSVAQTASATTSHYIAAGERLDFAVPSPQAHIAVIRAGSTDTVIELTEMS